MRRAAGALLLCCLFLAGSAAATTMQRLTLADLKAKATRIVEVEAIATENEAGDEMPFTRVICRVRRTLRGPADDTVVLRVPGGKRGELTALVPGAPMPEIGDVFVAFIEADAAPHRDQPVFRPIALGQGVFALVERDGAIWAVQALDRAPERFRDCGDSTAACLRQLPVLGLPLSTLDKLAGE